MILSSSVRDGGRVSIEIIVIISAVIPTIVVVGVGIVGFWGTALLFVVPVLSASGVFSSAAFLGRLFDLSAIAGVFLSSWAHRVSVGDAIVDGDGRFRSKDAGLDVVVRQERYLFWLVGVGECEQEKDEYADHDCSNSDDCDYGLVHLHLSRRQSAMSAKRVTSRRRRSR